MPRRNKFPIILLLGILSASMVFAQAPAQRPAQTPPAPNDEPTITPPPLPDEGAPAQPSGTVSTTSTATGGTPDIPSTPQRPPNQPSDTIRVQNPQAPSQTKEGVYVFKANVEEVVLHATVVDERNRLVTSLTKENFLVYENGEARPIRSFRREDIPIALGILIDNSGSMRDKRPAVNQAALNLVKASNPKDEVFIVNFNDEPYLDQDFTDRIDLMKEALEKVTSRGGTALYDAVIAAADYMKKNARLEKKVLLIVTDGEDLASMNSLEQAVRVLQDEDGPTVYTIGILGEEKTKKAKRALTMLADQTGGVAFFPRDLSEVDTVSQSVAHDIRNQYTIGYQKMNDNSGAYRQVKVEAQARGFKKLNVRTRSGYFSNREQAKK